MKKYLLIPFLFIAALATANAGCGGCGSESKKECGSEEKSKCCASEKKEKSKCCASEEEEEHEHDDDES